jgi:two-component system, NtrC family, response regulator AtoC
MIDILLIDDESSIRLAVSDALREVGHRVTTASDGAEGLARVAENNYDVVITDVRLPRVDGLTIFKRVLEESPGTDVILITSHGTVTDAVAALKEGASDYLLKPFDMDEIRIRVERSAEKRKLERDLSAARTELEIRDKSNPIIGTSPKMAQLIERIDTISSNDSPVLITGETGTGKELVARRLHALSPRRDKPFVAVNCAAFPDTLLEAELFGHEKGAFTGAIKSREGRFKAADGGTIFLDEIAETPPAAQAKLLRVLQDGVVEPLGTNRSVTVDVRLISATHEDLKERIAQHLFREDLYYRLKVLDVHLPPLRQRRADLPILVDHFLRAATKNGAPPAISPRAWGALTEYAFPGNVRELEHALERAVVLAHGKEIDLEHLPDEIAGRDVEQAHHLDTSHGPLRPLSVAMKEFEREYLRRALVLADHKKSRAAEMLAISRKNLWEKLRAHGLSDSGMSDAI